MSAVEQPRQDETVLPPSAPEIEVALLGLIFRDNAVLDRLEGRLGPEAFFDPTNAEIFETCRRERASGRQATSVTIYAAMRSRIEPKDDATFRHFLAKLENVMVLPRYAEHYADHLADLYKRRLLFYLSDDLAARALADDAGSASDRIAATIGELERIDASYRVSGHSIPLGHAVDQAIEAAAEARQAGGRIAGVETGIAPLDATLGGGLANGALYILGARPSQGKTMLALNIAENVAARGRPVLFVSLEMTAKQLAERILAGRTGITVQQMLRGRVDDHELSRLVEAKSGLPSRTLEIDAPPTAAHGHVIARAKEIARTTGLGLVVVDYGNLLEFPEADRFDLRVDAAVKALKAMARELDVPLLLCWQLSKANERRENKRPAMADLRDAGQVEQHADGIMLIHREFYYLERGRPTRGPKQTDAEYADALQHWENAKAATARSAEIDVAKNRVAGLVGVVTLDFDGPRQRFSAPEQSRDDNQGGFDL